MRAFKFLNSHGSSVFSAFVWPGPDEGRPGPWVEAAVVEPCRSGVHACRLEDLAFWLNHQLFEIELDGEVVTRETKVVAPRGRLVRRIEAWDGGAVSDLGAAVAWRTRELAAAALEDQGLSDPAGALRACTELEALGRTAAEALRSLDAASDVGTAVAYAGDAAHFARRGEPCEAPFVAACAAGHAVARGNGDRSTYRAAFVAERRAQSEWLTKRLDLA